MRNCNNNNIIQTLQPEYELEFRFLESPLFLEGLQWGRPRYGHPEGEVYKHIREVLDNIDLLPIDEEWRKQLRLIAFVHDTFKFQEDKTYPRNWDLHHGRLARDFFSTYSSDEVLLNTIHYHDEFYHAWRTTVKKGDTQKGQRKQQRFFKRFNDYLQFYYFFFIADTYTGNKNLAPVHWFESLFDNIQKVVLPHQQSRQIIK